MIQEKAATSALPTFAEFLTTAGHEVDRLHLVYSRLPSQLQRPDTHSVALVRAWCGAERPVDPEYRERGSISRGDLFRIARKVREGHRSWADMLAHTYAWGWGGTSLGPSRLARVMDTNGADKVNEHLASAVETLDGHGAVAAYWDLNNSSRYRLKHLGPAFFTKFLYFADAGLSPDGVVRPLILDRIVASRVNDIIDCPGRLRVGGWTTRDYAFYLALMDRLATHLNHRDGGGEWATDAVELGIFKQ